MIDQADGVRESPSMILPNHCWPGEIDSVLYLMNQERMDELSGGCVPKEGEIVAIEGQAATYRVVREPTLLPHGSWELLVERVG